MLQDILALPATGGALCAGVVYAALSVFVTNLLVGERTIENSGYRCTVPAKPWLK